MSRLERAESGFPRVNILRGDVAVYDKLGEYDQNWRRRQIQLVTILDFVEILFHFTYTIR